MLPMANNHPDDDDGQGPEPEAMHWHWQQTLFMIAAVFVLALVVGCSSTLDGRRIYSPAPHYQGYALEFNDVADNSR